MKRPCTYLRIVATTRCNLSCSYCHLEGDPQKTGTTAELPLADLQSCLHVASNLGMRKYKFLGGEPLVRKDLPSVIQFLRQEQPEADISLITAGVLPERLLHTAYSAGLSRANISIHGFSPQALGGRIGKSDAHALRSRFIEAALSYNRPIKLNYVYGSAFDAQDLGALLDWAAPRKVLVNVLDDLNKDYSWRTIADAVERLRGKPDSVVRMPDPDSLDTLHWRYNDGLQVEIKTERLGDFAPFSSCQNCPKRARCKEGIYALRLTHDGFLQPCMDRPDLRLPLAELIRTHGIDEATRQARTWLEAL